MHMCLKYKLILCRINNVLVTIKKIALILIMALARTHSLAKDLLLLDLDVREVPAGKVEIKIKFDGPPPVPTAFVLKSPDRVLIDMWGVENGTTHSSYDVGNEALRSVELVQVKGRLRVVANLNAVANYSSYAQDNYLYVVLDENSRASSAQNAPVAAAVKAEMPRLNASNDAKKTRVQGIDFERAENGIGRVKIKLSNDRAGIEVLEEGNNLVVNLSGAILSNQLSKRFDVQDFNTPVMFVDTFSQGQNAGILIKPSAAPYKFKSYQVGRELIVDVWPQKRSRTAGETSITKPSVLQPQYSGEKIDLNFQNVNIRSVLQIIAEVAQKNLVVDDSVSGSITLRLLNVPWDQALDLVLKTRGLDKRVVGNVLLVAPVAKLVEREKIELEGQRQVEELSPIETDFIQINYRKSSEMKARLEEASLVTKRGFVLADDATNVLMIRETRKQLAVIRDTLSRFDKSVSQIMIEAKLVVATKDVSEDLGVRWGLGYNDGRYVVGGGANDAIDLVGASGGIDAPLAVDLGVSAESAIRLGYISGSGVQLSAELSALSTTGDTEIVSQPKVITTNGQPAEIQSGQELPYVVVDDGTPTISFKDVVLSLKVTPQITPGDRVAMLLELTQDSIGSVLPNGEVSINKNSLKTSVVVKDGDTIVLGGVYRNEITNSVAKTPVLGDIPVLGRLFRQTRKSNDKSELLIFITPKLIRENLSLN
mgnify:CR=1 FL=1